MSQVRHADSAAEPRFFGGFCIKCAFHILRGFLVVLQSACGEPVLKTKVFWWFLKRTPRSQVLQNCSKTYSLPCTYRAKSVILHC